jgi:putative ABC transport system permease protein
MRLIDHLSLATRMFKTRPLRTFLTVLGVSVGIGAVLFLVSLGYGIQQLILNRITTADSLLSLSVTSGSADFLNITEKDAMEIASFSEVAEVSRDANLSGQLNKDEYTGDCLLRFVEPSFFRLSGVNISRGKFFKDSADKEVILSSATLKLFNLNMDNAVGAELMVDAFVPEKTADGFEELKSRRLPNKYKVVGVIEDETSNYAFIPFNAAIELNVDKYDQLQVKVKESEKMNLTREKIVEKGFLVSSLSDTIDQAKKIFRVVQIILALFGLVALVVSAIGMFNTMTIALLERINEIGIMRAIGITRADIMKVFLMESLLMGFLGGIGGIGLGFLGGFMANFGVNMLAKAFGGQSLNLFYSPSWFLIFIIVFSSFIGFATGVYPSLKASRLNPLDALRYK